MQALFGGVVVGAILGTLYGPQMLRRTRDLSRSVPGKAEVWLTGLLLLLAIPAVFRLPEGLMPDPQLVMLAYGFGCLLLLLPWASRDTGRLPLVIQLMHVFAGVLVLMVVAQRAYFLLISWLAASYH